MDEQLASSSVRDRALHQQISWAPPRSAIYQQEFIQLLLYSFKDPAAFPSPVAAHLGAGDAHHNGAAFNHRQFAVAGSDNLENQLGPECITGTANGCARRLIGTVNNAGLDAGAALNSDFMALADQLLDGFRGSSNPCFTRLGFEGNTNVHFFLQCY